jgi:small subunit ribosomal protein S21
VSPPHPGPSRPAGAAAGARAPPAALKRKLQREGMFRELKRRRAYEKPSERRAREKAEGVRRRRKALRKALLREDSS